MIKQLPLKAGRYRASRNVILYVSTSCNPYFLVQFRYKRDGQRKDVFSKFYVRTADEFDSVQRMAIAHAQVMFAEIRKAKDAFLKQEVLRAEAEHRARLEEEERNAKQRAETAKRDVQRVWAIYGPALNMREPFYIFQWGG
jgi:hypothetical protein